MVRNAKNLLFESSEKMGVKINNIQEKQLDSYLNLLVEWNGKFNLTAITDENEIVLKHFIDSMTILDYIPKNSKTLLDVGAGAGFPGIIAKIFRQDLKITLLDSLKKRTVFLEVVCNNLKLEDISVVHGRAEDFGKMEEYREKFDIVTARALANMNVLSEYTLPFAALNGLFVAMKGSSGNNELVEAKNAINILGGIVESVTSFSIPSTDIKRTIILVRKFRQTPTQYPRKSGKPSKFPLK